MKPEEVLTPQQKEAITDAIGNAEKNTSGEIRIHLDGICKGNPVKRAEEVFMLLGMDKTAQRNGILIYVACESKVFAIIGDKGINDLVPDGFWNDISEGMANAFRKGDFAGGLEMAIEKVGEKLKVFFPYTSDDVNEQPDEISFASGSETGRTPESMEDKK